MTTVARCNAAFAGLGAGLVHVSPAAGGEGVQAPVVGVLGAVEILWAVLVLARGRIVVPRTALVVAVASLAAFALALALGALAEPLPALAAAVLQLIAVAVVAVSLRSPRAEEKAVSPSRALVGLWPAPSPSRPSPPRPGRLLGRVGRHGRDDALGRRRRTRALTPSGPGDSARLR